ncbi:MAG TPA: thiolase family protein, partial [Ramlibacter sp.]|nr:thiolase family protein [Ramlibacter sp.]
MHNATALRRRVAIVGVGMTHQGDHGDVPDQVLALHALQEAMADAGVEDKHRIDAILGAKQYDGSGIDAVAFGRTLGITPGWSGALDYPVAGFTLHYAAMLIASGACGLVAVVYARNPPGVMQALSGAQEYDLSHGFVNAAAVHALAWSAHMAEYGTSTRVLGRIAVQQRRHARLNPLSSWQEPLSLEDYERDALVIAPLRELDICKVTAGGVAILLAAPEIARDCAKRPVDVLAIGREASHGLERGEHMSFFSSPRIAEDLFTAGGVDRQDVDALYVYDPTTVAVAGALENFGFCEPGACEKFVGDGSTIGLGG